MKPTPRRLVFALGALALLAGASCTARLSAGAQCAYNSDCNAALRCVSSQCREACQTDRDCASGQRCAPTSESNFRACLSASAPAQCPSIAACPAPAVCVVGGLCRVPCRLDRDCLVLGSGVTCAVAEGSCSQGLTVGQQLQPPADAGPDASPDAAQDASADSAEGGVGVCDPSRVVNLAGRAPDSDGWLRVTSDNTAAPATAIVELPESCVPSAAPEAHQVAFRYVTRSESFLAATTVVAPTAVTFDVKLLLLDRCAGAAAVLACSDDVGVADYRARLRLAPLFPAGTELFLLVGADAMPFTPAASVTGPFGLWVRELTPVGLGSACDLHGDTTRCRTGVCAAVDATHARCAATTDEAENNDAPTASTLQLAASGAGSFVGVVGGTDDPMDCFRVRVTAGQTLLAYTHDGNGNCSESQGGPANTVLELWNPAGTTRLAMNDDAPDLDRCSRIDGTLSGAANLPAGDYPVCVRTGGTRDSYVLSVSVSP